MCCVPLLRRAMPKSTAWLPFCAQDTRQQIKDGLKDACGVLQVYETTCNEAVNDYADLAFNVALQVRQMY